MRDEWLRSRAASKAANMRLPGDDDKEEKPSARSEDLKKDSNARGSMNKASAAARTPKDNTKRHSVGEDKRNVSWGAVVASLSGSAPHHADSSGSVGGGLDRASRYKRELRELDDLWLKPCFDLNTDDWLLFLILSWSMCDVEELFVSEYICLSQVA
jgi:hypothetical protein